MVGCRAILMIAASFILPPMPSQAAPRAASVANARVTTAPGFLRHQTTVRVALLAVILDATIVRARLVPAAMRLMGRWNWWIPAPIARLCRWVSAPAAREYSSGGG